MAAYALAFGAEQLGQLEHGGGADDRRREQKGKAGRIPVGEADDEATAHRRARAGEAGDERERLRRADQKRLPEAHP